LAPGPKGEGAKKVSPQVESESKAKHGVPKTIRKKVKKLKKANFLLKCRGRAIVRANFFRAKRKKRRNGEWRKIKSRPWPSGPNIPRGEATASSGRLKEEAPFAF
jgi:hypothetical protein